MLAAAARDHKEAIVNGTQKITDRGVSIWLDYLSRDLISSGGLQKLLGEKNVVGVTTNPSIFQKSITETSAYDLTGFSDADAAAWTLISDDVRAACDVMRPAYDKSGGADGRVSIEVDPRLAHDFARTKAEVDRLYKLVGRENVMVKIPATPESIPAMTEALAQGVSVNATLIFSHERYREVMGAFVDGVQAAKANGLDVSKLHSVASFFVSRIDTFVDPLLEKDGSAEARGLLGKVAYNYVRLAYREHERFFAGNERWAELERAGAHKQRPLWASTGTKNPGYSPTIYVDALVYPGVVNTMPEPTLNALYGASDESLYPGAGYEAAEDALAKLGKLGVSMADVTSHLEKDGVLKFIQSWEELLADIQRKIKP